MKKKVEILAPAGSFDSMKAAVAAGADAVYMGGSRFGARAYAENPDETGMLEAINYVHLHGRQLYMTVNTLVKEDEMDDLYDYLLPYYQAGLDAVIVQDMRQFLDEIRTLGSAAVETGEVDGWKMDGVVMDGHGVSFLRKLIVCTSGPAGIDGTGGGMHTAARL